MSIRRFLSTEEAQSDEAFERMAHLLLEAIRLHAAARGGNRAMPRPATQAEIEALLRSIY